MFLFAVISYVDHVLLWLSKLTYSFKISSLFQVCMQASYNDSNEHKADISLILTYHQSVPLRPPSGAHLHSLLW